MGIGGRCQPGVSADAGEQVVVAVDGFAAYPSAVGNGRDVDRRSLFTQVAEGFVDAAADVGAALPGVCG